jgi:ribosomal protein L24
MTAIETKYHYGDTFKYDGDTCRIIGISDKTNDTYVVERCGQVGVFTDHAITNLLEPTFKVNDFVEVIEGFWKGELGRIVQVGIDDCVMIETFDTDLTTFKFYVNKNRIKPFPTTYHHGATYTIHGVTYTVVNVHPSLKEHYIVEFKGNEYKISNKGTIVY